MSAVWGVRRERQHWREARAPRQTVVHLPTGERVWVSRDGDSHADASARRVRDALNAEHGDLVTIDYRDAGLAEALIASIRRAEAQP